eukprot:g4263.t1
MKLATNILVLVLCLTVMTAHAEEEPIAEDSGRIPSDNRGVDCSAFANLKIRLTDVGRCSGIVNADCTAIAEAENVFRDAYKNWWADEGVCDTEKAVAAAQACATAVASVYTGTLSKVACTGTSGTACGWAIADGEAYGLSFATALAQASADAGGNSSNAFCVSDVEAKGGVIAEAAASSQAEACVNGAGFDVDFEEAFIASVATIVAEAFAVATADVCEDGKSIADAEASCLARAEVDSQQASAIGGEGFTAGNTDTIPNCVKAIKDNCCASEYTRRVCICRGCNGPLRIVATFDDGGLRTWKDKDGKVCKCV